MENLIKVELKDGIQVIDSRLVAKGLNIKHQTLMETIRKYQEKLEKLGLLTFETGAVKIEGARGTKYVSFCYLNELQCNFVVTLSRNTEAVVDFKLDLVVAFDKAKKEIKVLEEVIKESENFLDKKRAYYEKKGYSKKWIEARLKSVEIRTELESDWKQRGVDNARQFAILTAILSKGVFGITPSEHRMLKKLKKYHNLRDNMTGTELAFLILSEEATIDMNEAENPQTYEENKKIVEKSGEIAGEQRALYEKQMGKKVVSSLNFLPENRAKYLKKKNK